MSLYADASSAHGRFFCRVDDEAEQWLDGGSIATFSLNHVLCS